MATGITTADGEAYFASLTVQISAASGGFDASAVTFVIWTNSTDRLTVQGNTTNNIVVGTAVSDILNTTGSAFRFRANPFRFRIGTAAQFAQVIG